jgi:hypothetical protein
LGATVTPPSPARLALTVPLSRQYASAVIEPFWIVPPSSVSIPSDGGLLPTFSVVPLATVTSAPLGTLARVAVPPPSKAIPCPLTKAWPSSAVAVAPPESVIATLVGYSPSRLK